MNETTAPTDKATALAPFAFAVAEAMSNRAIWLGKVKQARWRGRSITHEEYAAVHGAYVKAKRKVREAVREYQRARAELRNGNVPVLTDEWREWLRMYGVID